jgi:putative membrane protein
MKAQLLMAALVVAFGCAGAASAQDHKSEKFLHDAMQGDSSEVMLGKLAADQGGSTASKHYGQMLMDDHAMHLKMVEKVAQGLNVPTDVQPTDEASSEAKKLAKLQGGKFDHEFAEYMMKDHRKDMAEYRKAAKMSGDVGKLARDTLPTLQKHLEAAEKLKG